MRALLAGLLVVLAGCVGQAQPFALAVPGALGIDAAAPGIHAFDLDVGGEPAHGLLAVPPGGSSQTLVVLAKGLAAGVDGWRPLMEDLTARGALAVAMEYRGPTDAWKVRAAVEDTLAATQAVRQAHPEIQRVILYGYSMGGEVSGLALARAPPGTFAYWVAGAGVMDLRAEWLAAASFQPHIEAETGGTPLAAPAAYAERSPVEQADAIAASGVQRAYLVHGAADTVVPAEQAERMAKALRDAGVPTTSLLVASEPGAWVCTPVLIACAQPGLPAAPAGHEAGWSVVVLNLLHDLVDGNPDAAASLQLSLVEGATGTRATLDVPTTPSPAAAKPAA